MAKLLVLFRRVLHLEQVGISSPSRTSSLMNKSKQLSSLHRLDVGNETLYDNKTKDLKFRSLNRGRVDLIFTLKINAHSTLNPRTDQM